MSRCSSLPSLGPNSIYRTSSASHGPTPTMDSPLFKDGYVYVDIKTYRRLAKIGKHYSNAAKFTDRESPKQAESKTAFRRQQRSNAKNIRKAKNYLKSIPVHNSFVNDTHSEYLRFLLTPVALSEDKKTIYKSRIPKSITSHPKFNNDLINPRQLPIYYGDKDHRSWVNDRRDPFLTSYALRHSLAIEEKRPHGTQLKSSGSDPFVFVGSNTRYVHNDKLAYILRSWHNTTRLDRKLLDLAIKKTVADYAPVKFKPMTYNEVITSQQFLKNRTHDTGFSGIGFNDKFSLATNPPFVAFQEKFEKTKNHPATFKLFWKTEALKESKARFVPRLIFGGSLESEIMERKQFQNFSKSMKDSRWNIPSKIGISNIEFPKLYRHHHFDKGWTAVAVDYSSQDVKMPRAIIDARTRVLARLSQLNGYSISATNKVVNAAKTVSHFNVLTPTGEVFYLNSGVPSGLYLGAEGNTINHTIIGNYLDLAMKFTPSKVVDSRYGDDWLRSFKPTRQNLHYLNSRDKLFNIVDTHLNMKTTVDLWNDHPLNHHEPAFLRRSFTEWTVNGTRQVVPIFDADRTLAKWVIPHSVVQTPQDSFDRSLGYLMLCGANPKSYGLIHNYMDSLTRSFPEITVPPVYSKMTLTTLTRDYYTQLGKPSFTSPVPDDHHFLPNYVPTQRLSPEDKMKISFLSGLSHRDILLSGDIEENPGPIKTTKNLILHFQRFISRIRRTLGVNVLVPSFSEFLQFKEISLSNINKKINEFSLIHKIYKRTIPGSPNAIRALVRDSRQKLSDRFTLSTSESVSAAPLAQNIHSEKLLRAVSRPNVTSPLSIPCPISSRIVRTDPECRDPFRYKMPGDFPCGIDTFYHICPLTEMTPHCKGHCPYSMDFNSTGITSEPVVAAPDYDSEDPNSVPYSPPDLDAEFMLLCNIYQDNSIYHDAVTVERHPSYIISTNHSSLVTLKADFAYISGFQGNILSTPEGILIS